VTQCDPQVDQHLGFTTGVVGRPAEGKSLLARTDRFLQPPCLGQHHAEIGEHRVFGGPIAGLPADGQGLLVRADRGRKPLLPV